MSSHPRKNLGSSLPYLRITAARRVRNPDASGVDLYRSGELTVGRHLRSGTSLVDGGTWLTVSEVVFDHRRTRSKSSSEASSSRSWAPIALPPLVQLDWRPKTAAAKRVEPARNPAFIT